MKTDPWSFIVQRLLASATTLDDRREVVRAIQDVFPKTHPVAEDVRALDEALSIALIAQRELCLGLSPKASRGGRRLSDATPIRGGARLDQPQTR